MAVVGKFFEGSRNEIWLTMLMAVLVVTSWGAVIPAAAYNGLVSGLFYNFFFLSAGEELSFHSASEWWLEAGFVAAGVASAILGRLFSRARTVGHTPQSPVAADTGRSYLWKPHRSESGSSKAKGDPWTS